MLISILASLALVVSVPTSAVRIEKRVQPSASYAIAGLRSPKARGWANETATVSPCGGLDVGARTEFPLTGGKISMLLTEEAYLLKLGFSNLSNPTSQDDFRPLMNTLSGGDQIGHLCQDGPDMSDFGLSVGQEITLQLEYKGGEMGGTTFFQCADIVLVAPTPENTNVTCFSATVSASSVEDEASSYHGSSASDSSSSSSTSASSTSGLSNAASGGIGAGVTVAIFLLVLLALWLTGVIAIPGRMQQQTSTVSNVLPGPGPVKTFGSDTSSLGSSNHLSGGEKRF